MQFSSISFTLHASRFTLHASRFTLHASRFTLHASRFTLHASRFTLHASRPCGLAHQSFHFAHRLAHADEHGAADDGVADMQLVHTGQGSDRLHVEVVERMAGIETHALLPDRLAGTAYF